MGSWGCVFPLNCSFQRHPTVTNNLVQHPKPSILSLNVKPWSRNLPQIPTREDVSKTIKGTSLRILDALIDWVFEIIDQPFLPSQSNFAPVDELREATPVTAIHGTIPLDFPEGVYLRNGANPVHGGLKSSLSVFGKTSEIWVEGEGMIHALYFKKDQSNGKWSTIYNNKYVETETFKLEKENKKPAFLPSVEGDSLAVLSSFLLNKVRFGMPDKNFSNTNVFEHSGKYYSISENDTRGPREINIHTLETLGFWDNIAEAWNRPFTSHPKRAPGTGELVTFGNDAKKPYYELGVISADGTKVIHKVDLKFQRLALCHDIGVTQRYNIIVDFPIIIDPIRLLKGGSIIDYEKENFARIGVMPRYGNSDSVRWFEVKTCCMFHIINCYEEDDEVVVMGCIAQDSIIPGPDVGSDKFEWFSRGFKHQKLVEQSSDENVLDEGFLCARPYEWRLNMETGVVKESYLLEPEFSMDFPVINEKLTGIKNKYGYTQVVDSTASSAAAIPKYGGLAKLFLQNTNLNFSQGKKEIEYHIFPENTFCSGSAFVEKIDAVEEDDGWLVTFVHNEKTNISEAYIIDAKNFSSEPVAKITLPCRVPYGFHGTFMPTK